MCGIAGIVYADRNRKVDRLLLCSMCKTIKHRGPDDEGYYIKTGIGLGMCRLSIIDLHTGHQPINNEDESVTVVLNGEIYNFHDLRRELQGQGHLFKTKSDTEVIVHLYEEYEDNCVEKLRGMFAFALWDSNREKLLLARDRLGVKPLYYCIDNDRLLFGSEIKAILQDPMVPRRVSIDAIDQMLTYGYFAPPKTCFEGICELPQASTLTYIDGRALVTRYWDLVFEATDNYDEEAECDQLISLLRESIRLRMISDVSLGALLSGGIDSALVVALMSKMSAGPVKTFTIGFDDPTFSELPYARKVAHQYGTEHHEFVVRPDVIEILPTLIRHHDAPFYDSSAIPTYYICKMASEHVKVVLSGDGGDELFAGYNIYLADKVADYYQKVPHWVHKFVIEPLTRLLPESTGYINKGRVLREFVRASRLNSQERYRRWTSKVKEETRFHLYKSPHLATKLRSANNDHLSDLFNRLPNVSTLNRMLYVSINSALPNDILLKVDRMSMASSLEVRSPFLDHYLHEFAATLPDSTKLNGWTSKYLLKRVAAELLPGELLKRPKHGFSIPLDRWLRDELSDFVREILLDPVTRSRGLFNQTMVEKIVDNHLTGRFGYGREIWMLLTIELWQRMYIDYFEYTDV